jgi:hypothetical protein
MVQAATLKLADTAKTFYSGRKLRNLSITWVYFENIFQDQFQNVYTDE